MATCRSMYKKAMADLAKCETHPVNYSDLLNNEKKYFKYLENIGELTIQENNYIRYVRRDGDGLLTIGKKEITYVVHGGIGVAMDKLEEHSFYPQLTLND